MTRSVLVTLAGLALLLAACGAGASSRPSGSDATPSGGAPSASASAAAVPSVEGVPGDVLAMLVADAASRADVAPSEVTVVRGGPVEFSDGSLDCPEPGMGYTQAIVPGYQVVLGAGGAEIDYRVGAGNSFLVCLDGQPAP